MRPRCLSIVLRCRWQVHAVRLRKDRIAVALEHRVLVYNFAGEVAQKDCSCVQGMPPSKRV